VLDRARTRHPAGLGGLEIIEAVHAHPHFPPHAHATYALGIVDWGVNRFRYRGAWHAAPAGAICTVTPDEVHTVEPAGGTGFAYRCIYPAAQRLQEIAEALGGRPERRTLLLPPVIEDRVATALLARLLAQLDTPGAHPDPETLLGELLARVVLRHAAPAVGERLPLPRGPGLERAHEMLLDRLAENLTLSEMAAEAEMPRFVFLRAFSRTHGLTPHAWVIQERVRRAQVLLRAGHAPAEVAAAVGFADQSHLSRHFKRLTGVTPGCYRGDERR
jgi:AraC-like DNA-binding protein